MIDFKKTPGYKIAQETKKIREEHPTVGLTLSKVEATRRVLAEKNKS